MILAISSSAVLREHDIKPFVHDWFRREMEKGKERVMASGKNKGNPPLESPYLNDLGY